MQTLVECVFVLALQMQHVNKTAQNTISSIQKARWTLISDLKKTSKQILS